MSKTRQKPEKNKSIDEVQKKSVSTPDPTDSKGAGSGVLFIISLCLFLIVVISLAIQLQSMRKENRIPRQTPSPVISQTPRIGNKATAATISPAATPTPSFTLNNSSAPSPEVNPSASPVQTGSEDDYLAPSSATVKLSENDLKDKTALELDLMRNEIYARHGRSFKDSTLKKHFGGKKWYKENNAYSDDLLSKMEKDNARFIHEYQVKSGKKSW